MGAPLAAAGALLGAAAALVVAAGAVVAGAAAFFELEQPTTVNAASTVSASIRFVATIKLPSL
jgi:adenine/guanine phosphoribosyltransferase-like PRPP-binding protein